MPAKVADRGEWEGGCEHWWRELDSGDGAIGIKISYAYKENYQ